ncbi:MAG: hypothetical protein AB9846_00025 [Tenuifilaceae bacterium]
MDGSPKNQNKNWLNRLIIDRSKIDGEFCVEVRSDVTFKGTVFKNRGTESRSPHDLAAALLSGKMSYPSVAYLDGESNLLTAVPGYSTPKDIEPILVFFAEDHYKTTKWEDFRAKFISKLK